MRSLFESSRPGARGRSIEVPGLLPVWLQLALFGAGALLALGVTGFLLFRMAQAALWVLG